MAEQSDGKTDRTSAATEPKATNEDSKVQHHKTESNESETPASVNANPGNLRGLLMTLVVFATVFVLYFGKPVLMPVVAGIMVSLLFRPVVRWLEAIHIPPVISAIAIVLSLCLAMAGGITLVSMTAATWLQDSRKNLQEVTQKLRPLRESIQQAEEKVNKVTEGPASSPGTDSGTDTDQSRSPTADATGIQGEDAPGSTEGDQTQTDQKHAQPPNDSTGAGLSAGGIGAVVLGQTTSVLTSLLIIGALTFFLLGSGDLTLRKLVESRQSLADKKAAVHGGRQLQRDISMFLLTTTAINTGVTLVLWGQFYLAGLDNALFWAVVGGVVNYIPYLGPIISFFFVLVASILQFDSMVYALLPPAMVLWTNMVEGYGISPTIFGKRFALNPGIVFLWLITWGFLWGLPGALLAVPMLVSFKIVCEHIPSFHGVATLLSADRPKHAAKALAPHE